jgi:predicted ribosomally synthesized peptide with nif11-like leader
MSFESANEFYQRLATDDEFRNQLENVSSDDRMTTIQAAGYDFTREEWETVVNGAISSIQAEGELSEADLETVAGGLRIFPMYGGPTIPRPFPFPFPFPKSL